mmetsp:Transcript_29390/g.68706  ORF Transcript_29390/g.68706 Transcript_29390/m.68706 type:complete len:247 (-) Transcript_29390:542-1282(-)
MQILCPAYRMIHGAYLCARTCMYSKYYYSVDADAPIELHGLITGYSRSSVSTTSPLAAFSIRVAMSWPTTCIPFMVSMRSPTQSTPAASPSVATRSTMGDSPPPSVSPMRASTSGFASRTLSSCIVPMPLAAAPPRPTPGARPRRPAVARSPPRPRLPTTDPLDASRELPPVPAFSCCRCTSPLRASLAMPPPLAPPALSLWRDGAEGTRESSASTPFSAAHADAEDAQTRNCPSICWTRAAAFRG